MLPTATPERSKPAGTVNVTGAPPSLGVTVSDPAASAVTVPSAFVFAFASLPSCAFCTSSRESVIVPPAASTPFACTRAPT